MEPTAASTPSLAENPVLGTGFNNAVSVLEIGEESDMIPQTDLAEHGLAYWYRRLNDGIQSFSTISLKDKVTFFQLLSIMIEAGVPLVKALYVLADQMKNIRFKHIIATMAQKIESGKSFSEAMEDFRGVFSDTQIGMIHAGEASGQLNGILKQVGTQEEKNSAVTSKIKGALIYPAVVMIIMFGAIFVILAFVVPQLMQLFTQGGGELPTSTKILIALSDFVVNSYLTIFAGLFVGIGGIYVWKRTAGGAYHWDNLMLHLPIVGRMIRNMSLAKFTRTLGSLLNSGITIVKGLQIDADAIGNKVYRQRILLAAEDVSRGIPLAENLTDSRFLFPDMVVSMISIGEQTAELSTVCDKIANYYDEQVDQMASNMSKLMEPLIMVTMGVIVGGLIISVMQPIFSLLDVVGNL